LPNWMFDPEKKGHLTLNIINPITRLARIYSRRGQFQKSKFLLNYSLILRHHLGSLAMSDTRESECEIALLMSEFTKWNLRLSGSQLEGGGEGETKNSPTQQQLEAITELSVQMTDRWKEAEEEAKRPSICEEASSAALLARGALHESVGNYKSAKKNYQLAVELSYIKEADRAEAQAGLERLASTEPPTEAETAQPLDESNP